MTTVPDIPVVQFPAVEESTVPRPSASAPQASLWAVDVPRASGRSPLTLAVLGVLAGVVAMALGAAAVISAGASSESPSDERAGRVPSLPVASEPVASAVERRALALLAKPSTERIAFSGSDGLVLAVGSGGRAAILVRGLERALAGAPYVAWLVTPSGKAVRVARFVGSERAVFLSTRLGSNASVVVSTARPLVPLGRNRVIAVRG